MFMQLKVILGVALIVTGIGILLENKVVNILPLGIAGFSLLLDAVREHRERKAGVPQTF
ncbi:MAG: hypothetical protein Q8P20_08440 [bacterium]|nr:hypothetical protein [bacterium]